MASARAAPSASKGHPAFPPRRRGGTLATCRSGSIFSSDGRDHRPGQAALWGGSCLCDLTTRARRVRVRAEHTTVAGERFQRRSASLAAIEVLAGVARHRRARPMPARGALQNGFQCGFWHRDKGTRRRIAPCSWGPSYVEFTTPLAGSAAVLLIAFASATASGGCCAGTSRAESTSPCPRTSNGVPSFARRFARASATCEARPPRRKRRILLTDIQRASSASA